MNSLQRVLKTPSSLTRVAQQIIPPLHSQSCETLPCAPDESWIQSKARLGLVTVLCPYRLVVALFSLASLTALAQPVLSGVTMYASSSAIGTWNGVNIWTTSAAGHSYNLYLYTDSAASPHWLNSANTAASLNPRFQLSVGTNVISFAGDSVLSGLPIGFNLYFDDNLTNNLISAVIANGGFSVTGQYLTTGGEFGSIPGAGSLSFFRNGYLVTLTDLHLTTPGIDLVSPFTIGPDGVTDTGGSFTLVVTQPTNTVSGAIINATWMPSRSPYVITGDVNVAGLDIQPGVQVISGGNFVFEVDGVLKAIGTPSSPITFSGAGWQGIFFNNSSPGSILSHCVVSSSLNSGVRVVNSRPLIMNSDIVGNASFGNGGGINVQNADSTGFELLNCRVLGNTAVKSGGGVYVVLGTSGLLKVTGCSINNNMVNPAVTTETCFGGGMFVDGNVSVQYTSIRNNTCHAGSAFSSDQSSGGGGIAFQNGNAVLQNSLVTSNSTITTGGGVSSAYGGGVVLISSGALWMTNSVLAANAVSASGSFGAVYNGGGISGAPGWTGSIVNSTFAYNNLEGINLANGAIPLINSIVFFNNNGGPQIMGLTNVTYSDVQGGFPGLGNINLNPVFQAASDPIIVPGSPCIDRGSTNAFYNDLHFPPSLGSSRNDMGAHGGPATTTLAIFPPVSAPFELQFYGGVPGYNYEIDASTDFSTWQAVTQFQIGHVGDSAVYVETNNLDFRCYRLVTP